MCIRDRNDEHVARRSRRNLHDPIVDRPIRGRAIGWFGLAPNVVKEAFLTVPGQDQILTGIFNIEEKSGRFTARDLKSDFTDADPVPSGDLPTSPGPRGNEVIIKTGQLNITRSNLLTKEKAEARNGVFIRQRSRIDSSIAGIEVDARSESARAIGL